MTASVSVVVPVYNEASFIPQALPSLIEAMESTGASFEILIVENGSSDGTAEAARRAGENASVEIFSLPEADYGAALRHGFLRASGEWVVNFDIDYFSSDFLRAVLNQPDSVDLVIGSKRDPESEDRRPFIRRIATRVFNLLLRVILRSGVSDTHGMKGFRHELVKSLTPQVMSTKDLFDTELVVRAERGGYKIVEVPVTVEEIRAAKSSLIKRAPRTVMGLLRIRRILKTE
jgi:glycosyltransferase involved in cell wall biosynthesis